MSGGRDASTSLVNTPRTSSSAKRTISGFPARESPCSRSGSYRSPVAEHSRWVTKVRRSWSRLANSGVITGPGANKAPLDNSSPRAGLRREGREASRPGACLGKLRFGFDSLLANAVTLGGTDRCCRAPYIIARVRTDSHKTLIVDSPRLHECSGAGHFDVGEFLPVQIVGIGVDKTGSIRPLPGYHALVVDALKNVRSEIAFAWVDRFRRTVRNQKTVLNAVRVVVPADNIARVVDSASNEAGIGDSGEVDSSPVHTVLAKIAHVLKRGIQIPGCEFVFLVVDALGCVVQHSPLHCDLGKMPVRIPLEGNEPGRLVLQRMRVARDVAVVVDGARLRPRFRRIRIIEGL